MNKIDSILNKNIINILADKFINFIKKDYNNNNLLLKYLKEENYYDILADFFSSLDEPISYSIYILIDKKSFCEYAILHSLQPVEPFIHNL